MKKALFIFVTMFALIFVSACGNNNENEEAMTLTDENWEEVQIAGKDKPTVFFHFTSVG